MIELKFVEETFPQICVFRSFRLDCCRETQYEYMVHRDNKTVNFCGLSSGFDNNNKLSDWGR